MTDSGNFLVIVGGVTSLGDAMRGPTRRTSLCSSTEGRSRVEHAAGAEDVPSLLREEMRRAKLCRPHSWDSGEAKLRQTEYHERAEYHFSFIVRSEDILSHHLAAAE